MAANSCVCSSPLSRKGQTHVGAIPWAAALDDIRSPLFKIAVLYRDQQIEEVNGLILNYIEDADQEPSNHCKSVLWNTSTPSIEEDMLATVSPKATVDRLNPRYSFHWCSFV